jgi:hypothetical protein
MYCSCYHNTGVLQPSALQEISSRDLRWKRDSLEIKEWSLNHFLGLSSMKIGAITFLIPGQDHAYNRCDLADENKLYCGVNFDTTGQQKG